MHAAVPRPARALSAPFRYYASRDRPRSGTGAKRNGAASRASRRVGPKGGGDDEVGKRGGGVGSAMVGREPRGRSKLRERRVVDRRRAARPSEFVGSAIEADKIGPRDTYMRVAPLLRRFSFAPSASLRLISGISIVIVIITIVRNKIESRVR